MILIMDMKIILMKITVVIFNIIYLFFKPLKLKNKITILSRQSNKKTVDIKLIENELMSRSIETVVLTKRITKNLTGAIKYAFHMIRQMYHISTSKIVVIDGYCILVSILKKKDGQKIVQIWHALGAIKKFGYQSIGKSGGNGADVSKVMKLYRNYDYVIAPSEATASLYSEAFDIDRKKIKLYGLPRIEYLLKEEDKIKKISEWYPQIHCKKNILYVPTFRRNKVLDIRELIKNFDLEKYNLIIKKHWLDKTDYSWLRQLGVIVDTKYTSMEWLKICDKVITDYSAIAFEAALLEKELYFYLFDITEYKQSVGLNIDLCKESINKYIYIDSKSLCVDLDKPYEISRVKKFRDKYINVNGKNCISKLGGFFVELMNS